MARETVLVVDDEEDILELVTYELATEGFNVVAVASGEDALAASRTKLPTAVVLDLMLPGVDGLDVCRRMRSDPTMRHILIVMLTAKDTEADIVTGLELGAADYVSKPFSPRALTARIKAVLRRDTESTDEGGVLRVRELVIHPGRHEVLAASPACPSI